jgi:ABC-type multidrug transport system fused ATPase/permease subunit
VLDEPTTGLDAASGLRILGPLRRLMADRTTIVISHSLLTVRDADVIVVLEQGRVVDSGTHDDLMERNGTYAQLFRVHGRAPTSPGATAHRVAGPAEPLVAEPMGRTRA